MTEKRLSFPFCRQQKCQHRVFRVFYESRLSSVVGAGKLLSIMAPISGMPGAIVYGAKEWGLW